MKAQVMDTGVGIPQEELSHIFNRFYKINSPSHSSSFSGLGLAIAKRILDLHDSAIKVDSELNSGTCFTFTLPIHTTS